MGILDGFELVEPISGAPTMTVTKNGVSFNKTTLEKLGCPEYVQVLIDKIGKRIAIVPCLHRDKGSRPFYKPGKETSNGVRWNNYDLKSTIETMMGWNLMMCSWKVTGVYSEEVHALLFNLVDAEDSTRS